MKKTTIIILFLLLSFELYSQKHDFSVLAVKGGVFVKKKDKNNWNEVKVGTKLFIRDEVKLNKGAYVGLVHQNGQTEEINKPGTYSIETIAKKVTSRKSNMTKKFADFVVSEISSSDDLLKGTDYHKYMETTGSVERAVGYEVDEAEKISQMSKTDESDKKAIASLVKMFSNDADATIVLKCPRTSYVVEDLIQFTWYKNPSVNSYEFNLTDSKNSSVYSKKTSDTTLKINLSDLKLKPNSCYYWTVSSGEFISNEYCIYFYDKPDRDKIESDVREIKQDFSKTITPLDYMILASYYEENNIMNRAMESYQSAINLAPEVKDYRLMYAKYLSRIGLAAEASYIARN